jgi:hypothetical protein
VRLSPSMFSAKVTSGSAAARKTFERIRFRLPPDAIIGTENFLVMSQASAVVAYRIEDLYPNKSRELCANLAAIAVRLQSLRHVAKSVSVVLPASRFSGSTKRHLDSVEDGSALATFTYTSRARVIAGRVCLSALLGWAWLQSNSRARRRRSTVPGPGGFGLHPRLPASLFQDQKTIWCGPSEKLCSLGLRAALFAPGRPNRSGRKGRQKHALQESHHPHRVYWTRRRDTHDA